MTDTKRFISNMIDAVPPSGIRKFFDMVIGMDDVISLGVGEPDFVTPWHIREACIYSLEKGFTSYTSNSGLIELREAISDSFHNDYGVDYNPEDQVLVTTGVSEAADLALRAIVNPGDEVIFHEPCYVSYKPGIIFAGGTPVTVSTSRENEFRLTGEQVEAAVTGKTKAIILSYPNNPTGAVMRKQDLEEVADVAVEHDLLVISDEVYDKLTYNGKHTCFSSLNGMDERTILLNGLSKSHAMTGLRIGYAMGPPSIISAMLLIHQYTMLCAPITAQIGAIEALKHGESEMQSMVREYNRRRRLFVSGLNSLGLDCFEPKGAFYAFPSIQSTGMTSTQFAEDLLRQQKVAVVPGDVFGQSGTGYLRCSYASSLDELKTALERIEEFLN
ncbi:MAG TPA: aminotransferase class I/II-fold pyridoxal phosphate-dependent enzyme [Candidatus Nanoarchaeia archaeon]|nr:aminotransferase class I/II-fold pyridoxal phosphate-dependent enzyme [Candidatus Nanoarchaeia archaeon]